MKRLLAFFLVLITLLPLAPTYADDTSSTGFNPNILLNDDDLIRYDSMTREDISTFLKNKGGTLQSFATTDKDGVYRTASDIIYRAAQEHQINPQYLLVKLQKEQSLVTDATPTQKQLDWATGFGVCDGCSLDDPSIQNQKGFGKQVDSAAGVMRWYFDNLNTTPWIKRPGQAYLIDNQSVTPATLATGFLYTYTPHLQGNHNFWGLWQRWFDQVYPDGTLIKTASDPTVYLIADGKRRPIATMTALVTRFDPKRIITVADTELLRYEEGKPLSLPNYSILQNGTAFYLLDNDTLRPFADPSVVRSLGYNPDEYVTVTPDDLAGYTMGTAITANSGSPIGRVVKLKENNLLYYIKDNQLHPIFDPQIAKINFPSLPVETITVAELGDVLPGNPILFKDGTLIGVKHSKAIFVIEHGKKRHIMSEKTFANLGYNKKLIVMTDEITAQSHQTGEPLSFDNTPDTLLIRNSKNK